MLPVLCYASDYPISSQKLFADARFATELRVRKFRHVSVFPVFSANRSRASQCQASICTFNMWS
jgi:hypothetical protein